MLRPPILAAPPRSPGGVIRRVGNRGGRVVYQVVVSMVVERVVVSLITLYIPCFQQLPIAWCNMVDGFNVVVF